MATTFWRGITHFIYNEMIMVQDIVDRIGVAIDSLIMEFDQGIYEAYLRGPASPRKATHVCKNICTMRVRHQPLTHPTQLTRMLMQQGTGPPPTLAPIDHANVSTCLQRDRLCLRILYPSGATRMQSAI